MIYMYVGSHTHKTQAYVHTAVWWVAEIAAFLEQHLKWLLRVHLF